MTAQQLNGDVEGFGLWQFFCGLHFFIKSASHLMMVTQFLMIAVVGEDFWRWQTMNPDGYRGTSSSSASRTSVIVNGSHLNGH